MGKTRAELDSLWSDPKNWTAWRYRCADDPRLIVPKRARWRGWTVNFAHPLAWQWLIGLMILTGGPVVYVSLELAARREMNIPLQMGVLVASIALLILICAYMSDFKDYSK
jgi:Family of unknown function (DUF5808)